MYTAQDINRMRKSIKCNGFLDDESYRQVERALEIEARLVTYLSQGITADDLESTLNEEARLYYGYEEAHSHYEI